MGVGESSDRLDEIGGGRWVIGGGGGGRERMGVERD